MERNLVMFLDLILYLIFYFQPILHPCPRHAQPSDRHGSNANVLFLSFNRSTGAETRRAWWWSLEGSLTLVDCGAVGSLELELNGIELNSNVIKMRMMLMMIIVMILMIKLYWLFFLTFLLLLIGNYPIFFI